MKIENIYMIQVTMVNYMELSSDAELDDCGEQFEEKLREISEELKKLGVDEKTMTEWIKGGTEHD